MQISQAYELARQLNKPIVFIGQIDSDFEQDIDYFETDPLSSIEEAQDALDFQAAHLAGKEPLISIFALIGDDIKITALEKDPPSLDICLKKIEDQIQNLQLSTSNSTRCAPMSDESILELACRAGLKSRTTPRIAVSNKDKKIVGLVRLALVANRDRARAIAPSVLDILDEAGGSLAANGPLIFPNQDALAKYGQIIANICYGVNPST